MILPEMILRSHLKRRRWEKRCYWSVTR